MSTTAVPNDELVGQVREAWADVLCADSAESVPLDVNFLEAGGNSLLLVMLWEQLQPLASRTVKLSDLFRHGTVRAQAELLAGGDAAEGAAASAASPAGSGDAQAPAAGRSSLLARRRAAGGGAG